MADWFSSDNPTGEDITVKLITKQFLESVLHCEICSYKVESGSKPGDNYCSVLYTIQVILSPTKEVFYLLKCYPSEQSKQTNLNRSNHFYNELQFYSTLAKDLVTFQTKLGISQPILPPIPPFHGGSAVNYQNIEHPPLCSPLDNFILMTDMRKPLNFKMADRRVGLDGDHMKLTFYELATLHALSWAYKEGNEDFHGMYPFLEKQLSQRKVDMWMGLLKENANMAVKVLDAVKGPGNNLSQAVLKFCVNGKPIFEYFHTLTLVLEDEMQKLVKKGINQTAGDYNHWRVVCHGDCWTNQMLFKYDSSGKPQHVVLVDFPLAKLGCPTFDLACLVYTSTRRSSRESHLQECFSLYYNRFLEVCQALKVPLLPGFSLESLLQRFHISKLPGFLISLLTLHLNLVENSVDGESTDMNALIQDSYESSIYKEWIVELIEDMVNDGVI